MKKILSLIIVMVISVLHAFPQNIECIGNPITIPLAGYTSGVIQWQFSPNAQNWTNIQGQNQSTLNYSVVETGYFRALITSGKCDYFSDTIFIRAYAKPSLALAGTDQFITREDTVATLSATIPATGRGKWSILSGGEGEFSNDTLPGAVFKGNSCAEYILKWTVSTGCMSNHDEVTINFHDTPADADAGADQYISNEETTAALDANIPEHGGAGWSIISGENGMFESDSVNNSLFIGAPCTDYVLRWTVTAKCGSVSDEVNISFQALPDRANAGDDITLTTGDLSTPLSGNLPETGTGHWIIVSGNDGVLEDDTDPSTQFSGLSNIVYTLRWIIETDCAQNQDDVNVTFL